MQLLCRDEAGALAAPARSTPHAGRRAGSSINAAALSQRLGTFYRKIGTKPRPVSANASSTVTMAEIVATSVDEDDQSLSNKNIPKKISKTILKNISPDNSGRSRLIPIHDVTLGPAHRRAPWERSRLRSGRPCDHSSTQG